MSATTLAALLGAGAALCVIVGAFASFAVWIVRRILQAGSWFAAVSANTAASKNQEAATRDNTEQIAGLRGDLTISTNAVNELGGKIRQLFEMVGENTRRIERVEEKLDDLHERINGEN